MRAMLMSMILSSGAFLVASPALADYASCDRGPFSLENRIAIEPKAARGPKLGDYQGRVLQVHSLLGNLCLPHESQIVIGPLTMWSVFDHNDFSIYIGIQPEAASWRPQLVDVDTLTHEYAHAVFEKNLRVDIPDFKNRYRAFESLEVEAEPHVLLYTALHELFADIVTVTTTHNPFVFVDLLAASPEVATSVKAGSSQLTVEDFLLRSMTFGKIPGAAEKWSELLQDAGGINEPYFLLLPTRWHFWSLVESRLSSPSFQKKVIPAVYSILKDEVERLLGDSQESLSAQDVHDLNARLVQRLDEAL